MSLKKLNGFECDKEEGFGFLKWKGIRIFKPNWKGKYDIRIHLDGGNLRETFITIYKAYGGARLNTEKENNFLEKLREELLRDPVAPISLGSNDQLHICYFGTKTWINHDRDLLPLLPENRKFQINEWCGQLIDFAKRVEKDIDLLILDG